MVIVQSIENIKGGFDGRFSICGDQRVCGYKNKYLVTYGEGRVEDFALPIDEGDGSHVGIRVMEYRRPDYNNILVGMRLCDRNMEPGRVWGGGVLSPVGQARWEPKNSLLSIVSSIKWQENRHWGQVRETP